MVSDKEAKPVNRDAAELNRFSIRLWIVLSLVLLLTTSVILLKNQALSRRWPYAAALVVPISFGLYFRNRVMLLGPFVYVGAVVLLLLTAVFFGL
jgi:hypothetical protein